VGEGGEEREREEAKDLPVFKAELTEDDR